MLGIGLEDGENVERWWSRMSWNSNLACMRPENRRDFISALVDNKNEMAYIELPKCLEIKVKKAQKAFEAMKNRGVRPYAIVVPLLFSEVETISKEEFTNNADKNDLSEKLFEQCLLIKHLRLKQRKKKGSKTTAMIARAISASMKDLDYMLERYNLRFKTSLTDQQLFSSIKSEKMESHFVEELRFYKACEQVILTLHDIEDAKSNLLNLIESLNQHIANPAHVASLDLFKRKKHFFKQIHKSLSIVEELATKLKSEYSVFVNQLNNFK